METFETFKIHENSPAHKKKKAFTQWTEAEMRFKAGLSSDKEEQKVISKERLRWNNVLQRLTNDDLVFAHSEDHPINYLHQTTETIPSRKSTSVGGE